MESRGRGSRGHPRGDDQPPPVFYQQAFIETMGVAMATAAQENAVRGQEGASNIPMFKVYHTPTFKGGGDPMVVDH